MMKGFISRPSILEEILEIEAEIKRIRMNPHYRKLVYYLKRLNSFDRSIAPFSNPVMKIPLPDDLSKNLRIRRRSKVMKDIMYRYEELQLVYRNRIDDLRERRKILEKQLF